MLQYILETLVFQLVFLVVYDLFLKKETFFQWNRFYLLGTFLLSLFLPWIKIEALKTSVSPDTVFYPEFLFQLDGLQITPEATNPSFWELLSWQEWIYAVGAILMTVWFVFKLFKIKRLKVVGRVQYFTEFTKVVVAKSEVAFSFFKTVFLGDGIPKTKESQIVAHELVHIKQWHSLDLLFFELMRIVLWFNPLVYVYQNKIALLHEYIADAQVANSNKKEQYQLLLSEAFQTQNLSFVNQFFTSSLIKKRIVMLTKEKSKTALQVKYLLLLPLVLGMLVYSSCEVDSKQEHLQEKAEITEEEYLHYLKLKEQQLVNQNQNNATILNRYNQLLEERRRLLRSTNENNPIIISIDEQLKSLKSQALNSTSEVIPFLWIDEPPIFPGCDNASDKRACFQEKIQQHIRKHFNYPKEAQDLGIQGRVSIVFTIDVDGSITNIRKRGPHKLLEDETERIIKRLPKMIPGKQEGEAVKVPFSIPITFKLQDSSDTPIPFPKMATENEGLNIEVKEMILKYNKLVNERERLLKSANRKNPIIVSLEEQLTVMKIRINESIEKTN